MINVRAVTTVALVLLAGCSTTPDAYTGTSPYLVFDARAQYRHDEHWSAAFGVDNIGDQLYWASHPYPQRSFSAELRYDY